MTSLGLQWIVGRLGIPMPSYAPLALLALSSILLLSVAVVLIASRRWPRWATPLSWSGLSALGTLPFALLLQGTRFYLFGVDADQFFRTQYLTRLTESAALADGNYADVPPFYPAGWFWLGGRFANLFELPAWATYKPYAILTMAVAPVVAFVLWSLIVRRPVALLLSVLTCIAGLRLSAYQPYSWLLVAPMVPVAVIAWRQFRARAAGHARHWRPIALCGIFFGVCGAVYTLLFGFFAFVLLTLAAAAVLQGWRRAHAANGLRARMLLLRARSVLLDLVAVALIALPIVLLVWTPYLLRAFELGRMPSGAAPRYLFEAAATVPTPMFSLSAAGVLAMGGTIWLVLCWRRSETVRALAILAVCCYAWYLLSFLMLSMHTTLLAFRVEPVLVVTLFCAGGLAGLKFTSWVSAARFVPSRVPAAAVVAVVALLGMVSMMQTIPEANKGAPVFKRALHSYYPSGVTALGGSDPADDGAWNNELFTALDAMTTRPPNELVMLTTYFDLLAFRPYWGFQTRDVHYANPMSNFAARRQLIESWARSSSSAALERKLRNSPYDPPDVFVLREAKDGLHMQVSRDTFPKKQAVQFYDVVFPKGLFRSEHFKRRDVGPFTVIVRE